MTNPTKKQKDRVPDRNWIKPPNTIVHQGSINSPQKLSYWTDKNGQAKLYTKEQLATCNILMNLNQLLVRALLLFDTLNSLDEDTKIGTFLHQDYAKFEATESSAFDHFVNLMSAAPDITFGEFLGYLSTNSDPREFIKMGQKNLKEVIRGKSTRITNFYTSDQVKKS